MSLLELARLKESSITNKLLKVSSAAGLETRKRGTETPESKEAEFQLMGPQGGSSIRMRLVARL